MPRVTDLEKLARELRDVQMFVEGQTVQPGMFSTLDEAIREAPFERAPAEQWARYLQPGRMVRREDVQFPLKKEEIDYSGIDRIDPARTLTREELRGIVRNSRPSFALNIGREVYDRGTVEAVAGNLDEMRARVAQTSAGTHDVQRLTEHFPQYGVETEEEVRLFHKPRERGSYEESVTEMQGIDAPSHFGSETLSWSRVTTHELPQKTSEQGFAPKKVRLVEEIQSDLHQRARENQYFDTVRGKPISKWSYDQTVEKGDDVSYIEVSRRGYMPKDNVELDALRAEEAELSRAYDELNEQPFSDEIEEQMEAVEDRSTQISSRINRIMNAEPDAPFKNPKDYAGLELRKQLYEAARSDDDYLALTRGQDQIDRYSLQGESAVGTQKIYDELYKSELKKLAKRYGAKMTDVEVSVTMGADVRPEPLREMGAEDFHDYMGGVGESVASDYNEEGFEEILEELMSMRRELEHASRDATGTMRRVAIDKANDAIGDFEDLFDEWLEKTKMGARENPEEVSRFYRDFATIGHRYADNMHVLMDLSAPNSELVVKSFPAIELTPEIRAKILRTGVPLFARGGLVRASKGGRVRDLVEKIKEAARNPDDEKLAERLARLRKTLEEIPDLDVDVEKIMGKTTVTARSGDQLLGALQLNVEDDLAYPGFAHVMEGFRKKGIGSALYLEAARMLKEQGKRLHASDTQSEDAMRLWERFPTSRADVPARGSRSSDLMEAEPTPTYLEYAEGGKVGNVVELAELFRRLQKENEEFRRDASVDDLLLRGDVVPMRPGMGTRARLLPWEKEPEQFGTILDVDEELATVQLDDEFVTDPDDRGIRHVPLDQIEIDDPLGIESLVIRETKPRTSLIDIPAASTEHLPPGPGLEAFYKKMREEIDARAAAYEKKIAKAGHRYEIGDVVRGAKFRHEILAKTVDKKGRPVYHVRNLENDSEYTLPESGILGKFTGPEKLAAGGMVGDPYLSSSEEFAARQARESSLEDQLAELRELGRRYLSGFKSQWMTLNPETGEAEWVLPQVGPGISTRKFRPGIVDETLALPNLIKMFPQELVVPEPYREAGLEINFPFADEAEARSEALRESVRRQMELSDPEGFAENFAESAGMMTGQLPVPASALRSAERVAGPLSKLATSGVEYVSPIVEPRLINYLAGSTFGGGMGAILSPSEEELSEEDAEIEALWESLTPEQQAQVLKELEARGLLEEQEGFSRGGRVADAAKRIAENYVRLHNEASKEYRKAFADVGARMWSADEAHPLKKRNVEVLTKNIRDTGSIEFLGIPRPLTVLDSYPDMPASQRKKLKKIVDEIHRKYSELWSETDKEGL